MATKKKTAKKKAPRMAKKKTAKKNEKVFLVCSPGERHEDLIPEAFVTFSQLKEEYKLSPIVRCLKSGKEISATEKNMTKSGWFEIFCLDDNWKFTPKEVSHYKSHGTMPDGKDFEPDEVTGLFVIHVNPNKSIPVL